VLNDSHAVALDELPGGDDLLGLLPVDHLEVVEVVLGRSDFEPRSVAHGKLGVEGVDEAEALARELSGVSEVLVVRRELNLEALLRHHAPGLRVDEEPRRVAAVQVGIPLQGGIAVLGGGPGGDRRDVGVLGVRCNAHAVGGSQVGDVDDLLGLEVAEVDHPDPTVGPVVDVEPTTVVLSGRLRERGMVTVAPAELAALGRICSGLEHTFPQVGTEAVARIGVTGEDRDDLEQAHRGDADNLDLTQVPGGREHVVGVVLARRHHRLKGAAGLVPRQPPARRQGTQLPVRGHAGTDPRTDCAYCSARDHASTDCNELSTLHSSSLSRLDDFCRSWALICLSDLPCRYPQRLRMRYRKRTNRASGLVVPKVPHTRSSVMNW
jgi:hypothetical protein